MTFKERICSIFGHRPGKGPGRGYVVFAGDERNRDAKLLMRCMRCGNEVCVGSFTVPVTRLHGDGLDIACKTLRSLAPYVDEAAQALANIARLT